MRYGLCILALLISPVWAGEYNTRIDTYIKTLQQVAREPVLTRTLMNASHECQSLIGILAIEKQWAELSAHERQIMVSENQLGYRFRDLIAEPDTDFVEFILSSEQGETVAAWPAPSDYWQGDETKFIQPAMQRKPVVERFDWDESSSSVSLHISVPVFGQQGLVIGVLTAGIEVDIASLKDLQIP
ncbi:MAG: cache domain-containing protein [Oceanospirillaceae bacterium]|nr:cache domain-containing protein [Oceanospirillaceae bacterium]MCP5335407.1 cache domain-containing protein [Oceanospirillaceae bacterium]MCP5351422.1 cache domain-containing protein [Oceanospirillaceae bacterium]